MQMIASSIGLVKSKLPTLKIGLKSNELRPGAGKPQPDGWNVAPALSEQQVGTHP